MVVLDATIVTIAIPSAQEALHFSTESRQWIVTAYALAFGSLLLLGIASAMVNTSQQVGGSVGIALLSTIFASAVASYAASHLHTAGLADAAAVHGYTTAFWWAVGTFALGFLLALLILPGRSRHRQHTLKTALARLAICNCHYFDSTDGTRRGVGATTHAEER
jgi:MFS family permease